MLTPVLLGLFGGIVAWFATEYVAREVANFNSIRRDVVAEICFLANIDRNPKSKEGKRKLNNAVDSLRRLGTRLISIYETSSWASWVYLSAFRFRPRAAGSALIGMSNTLYCVDQTLDQDYAVNRDQVERGLRLRTKTYTQAQLQSVLSAVERRHASMMHN